MCKIKYRPLHCLGEKPFACNYCENSFIRKIDLVRHERTHTGEKPYSCHVCDKSFGEKCYLVKHERTHSDVKPYSCEMCDKSFTSAKGLKYHEKKCNIAKDEQNIEPKLVPR